MKQGESVPSLSFPAIAQAQLNLYAEASGDPNPIHLDEAVAKKAGLPGVIAHGMLIAGLITERALKFAPGWKIGQVQFRFKGMTLLGDQIAVGGSVKSATDSEMVLDLQASNQAGEMKSSAQVTLRKTY